MPEITMLERSKSEAPNVREVWTGSDTSSLLALHKLAMLAID